MRRFLIAIFLGCIMLLLFRFDSFYMIENALSDKLTMQTRAVDPRIKILAIDSDSLEKVGRWPWPRGIIVDLIDEVASKGALAVWPDILFTEKSEDSLEDQALADVVEKYQNVYLPVYFELKAVQNTKLSYDYEYLKKPVVDIPVERIGHINVLPDHDNVIRRIILGIPTLAEEIIPIIDVRIANLLLDEKSRISWDDNYIPFLQEAVTVFSPEWRARTLSILERRLEFPMLGLALVWLTLLVLELVRGLSPLLEGVGAG